MATSLLRSRPEAWTPARDPITCLTQLIMKHYSTVRTLFQSTSLQSDKPLPILQALLQFPFFVSPDLRSFPSFPNGRFKSVISNRSQRHERDYCKTSRNSPHLLTWSSFSAVTQIDGSLASLFYGIMLKKLGHNVRILEQIVSSVQESQAAGIS